MSTNECVFCKMVSGQIPVTRIYEDDAVLSFLDIGPISDGHTLLIPKQHYPTLAQCPEQVLSSLCDQLGKISNAVAKATKADGYNVLCNNRRAAGQLVPHVHFHIIPRKSGDGLFPTWPAYEYEKGKIEQLAADIRNEF